MKKLLFFLCCLSFVVIFSLTHTLSHYKHKSRNPFQVNIPLNVSLFEQKLAKEPPEWMIQQIQSDLNSYEKTKISKDALDLFFQGERIRNLNLIRFTLQNRQISCSLDESHLESRQFRHILAAIKKLNQLTVLPDVDFIVSLEDGFTEELGIPLFVYAKAKTVSSLILMPDFKALTGYPTLRKQIEKGNQKWPWQDKITKAFWRGSTTGGWLTLFNWDQIARVKLAILAQSHPKKVDARITKVVQCDLEIPQLISEKGLLGKMISQQDHLKYKYLIDVDGNSCSFERYFWALLSNCLVLKQMTPNIQWYYGALKPYEHFIPVKEDLSDLLEKIEWAQTHDQEAKQIAENATRFVKNELAVEDILVYMTHLLREYAKHQN